MKRLSESLKRHLLHRAESEARKLRTRPASVVSARRETARKQFLSVRAELPEARLDYECRPGYCTIVPPEQFNLVENYDETLAFLLDMRSLFHQRGVPSEDGGRLMPVFADFAAIRDLSPPSGLVLAAEVDRWRLTSGRQPRCFESEWHPDVRRYFEQAGLFELLGLPHVANLDYAPDGIIETLQFIRGFSVNGKVGSKLRDRLEALCGKSIGPRLKVYEAIAEAIANTRHAYPSGVSIWPAKLSGRWWASGAWNKVQNVISVHMYDQGVGIPATLPRSEHWSDILAIMGVPVKSNPLNPERADHHLLAAALEVGRTSTGVQGRGKGLAEMAGWIDQRSSGLLRITSGRGSITYEPGGVINKIRHQASFPGTLVEWEISLND